MANSGVVHSVGFESLTFWGNGGVHAHGRGFESLTLCGVKDGVHGLGFSTAFTFWGNGGVVRTVVGSNLPGRIFVFLGVTTTPP
jgi:hypothetical protein